MQYSSCGVLQSQHHSPFVFLQQFSGCSSPQRSQVSQGELQAPAAVQHSEGHGSIPAVHWSPGQMLYPMPRVDATAAEFVKKPNTASLGFRMPVVEYAPSRLRGASPHVRGPTAPALALAVGRRLPSLPPSARPHDRPRRPRATRAPSGRRRPEEPCDPFHSVVQRPLSPSRRPARRATFEHAFHPPPPGPPPRAPPPRGGESPRHPRAPRPPRR